ncbi:hypothetical protein AAF712_013139 [Marasmius tenuissimus]|uniref:Cytochrome P450 n=1 Tax=Marasmius tenuissimus TaxID=585030 RepID=A0ABR2ZH46_9AGAR
MAAVLLSNPEATFAVLLGIANHLYFKRYEPDRKAVIQTACVLLAGPAIQLFALQRFGALTISRSGFFIAYSAFFATMATSIILYRLSSFHPLAKVPGPFIFRVTKFWRMYIAWTGRQHTIIKALHDQYGPIVCTGPNDISVVDLDSVKAILGTDGLPKAPFYLLTKVVGHPIALIGAKGEERSGRRRVWSRGFTSGSVKEYQHIVVAKANELSDGLFDFMGEMMFGASTGMLKHGKDDQGVMKIIQGAGRFDEVTSQIPWLTYLATFIPSDSTKLRVFGFGWGKQRVQEGAKKKDLWYHLADEEGHKKTKPSPQVVIADSILAIVAGSDTTSTALANFFWCIMAHPSAYKRVRDEIGRVFPPGTDSLLDTSRYENLKFTKACLFIAEETQVQVPPMSVHHNPNHFSPSPEAFIPERWLPEEAKGLWKGVSVKMKTEAFIPFSYGPANCIGKSLAVTEMMMVFVTKC